MPIGPGKYDALCTYVREQAVADGVIVVVFGGEHGSGFSVQGAPHILLKLPSALRSVAADLEENGVLLRDATGLLDS